ncbi:response regulator transcription factor [Anaerolentibacter hominis]|uniref:response regulator transcription factor n=1 Tax=Anaerolentibacter hominis TaxID=3079009 RepID=UPI0031B81C81
MKRILIAEDEEPIMNLIRMNLTRAGYHCTCCMDGEEAANYIEEEAYDLILLDIMLPGVDGYELLEYSKPTNTPVIFITAKSGTRDKVKGLRAGADDYITKPFEIIELLARVESVLRRYNKSDPMLRLENVEIDTTSRIVRQNGREINLTMKEYDLLLLFVQNKNIALYRETIYQQVWGGTYLGDSRTIDLHVQRLRKKLNWEDKIKAIYKIGYRLEVPK